ncbi:YdeI/OmpD-associated family protein [Elizabethkingia meningoseptica]|uniref:YdeI/OmpD-associated family protein n=1 Tax=Elizabethkingia meningoseptica TaxID=238 RepID=UPI002DD62CF8|nr:YdeI/OmpD-associated family protein [Elizabethkingia meningoseptica]MEC4713079.1 YdeI/OmpD-associated family protein [Elizabethkingia meningoseptica]
MLLVHKLYKLEKFGGKGGWTFARIPEIPPGKNTPFNWVKVRGTIDDYEIVNYNLQSMGNGCLFLPVKADIRKKIKKQAGDTVRIVLYEDNNPTSIPEELILCLQEEKGVYEAFSAYTDGEKKTIIEWIYAAKAIETKADRIAKTINGILSQNPRY